MKGIKSRILAAFFISAASLCSYGSIIGSDITWSCLGNDSFLIKATVFNDCTGSAIGTINLNFKCQTTGTTITTLSLSAPTPVDITPGCNNSCTKCSSPGCSLPVGFNRFVYQGIVYLNAAGSCCNIIISMKSGYRSYAITTGAANAGFYNEALMNRCLSPCDNSPYFTTTPVFLQCIGNDFIYNHGAQDIDADSINGLTDSLTYEWANPMSDVNTNIGYNGSYTYNKPLSFYGFPNDFLPFPKGFHLDPSTGDIKYVPTIAQVTVMVLKVNEYRNGVKIAEIRRDLQVNIGNCSTNTPPSVSTTNNVKSMSVCAGDTVKFNFRTTDPDVNDVVTVNWNNAIPGATWTHTNGQTARPTATLTWIPADSMASKLPYHFTVTAKSCPSGLEFSQSYQIFVGRNPSAQISVKDTGCGNYNFKAALPSNSILPQLTWKGDSFVFSKNTGYSVSHQFFPGHYHFSLTVTSHGCSKIFNDSFNADSFVSVSLPRDTAVCRNSVITLNALVLHSYLPHSLTWGSGKTIFAGDTATVKQLTVNRDTAIWVRPKYQKFYCPSDQITIKLHPDRKMILPDDSFFCDLNYSLTPAFHPDISAFRSFRWFRKGSSTAVDSDAYLNAGDTGYYTCIATDTFGCIYSDSVHIQLNPQVIASAPDTLICSGSVVNIDADVIPNHNYTYQWWLGNTLLSSSGRLTVHPTDTTRYTLIASEIQNGVSCSASHVITVLTKALPVFTYDEFDVTCTGGNPLQLDSFVKVYGKRVSDGFWACLDDVTMVGGNYFFPEMAKVNMNPGYRLTYSYDDPKSGCNRTDTVYLKVYPTPDPTAIIISGDTSFCYGGSVSLSSSKTATHYRWSSGDSTKQVEIKSSGSYSLSVSNIYGCYSDWSDPVKVTVYDLPSTPQISLSPADSFLECSMTGGNYDWFYAKDTLVTPSAISNHSRKIDPEVYCKKCFFSVVFTDSNGCVSDTSAWYYFGVNGIDNRESATVFRFYPNPVYSELFVENPLMASAVVRICDLFGKEILEKKMIHGKNAINVQAFKPGIYFIYLDGNIAGKVIIE